MSILGYWSLISCLRWAFGSELAAGAAQLAFNWCLARERVLVFLEVLHNARDTLGGIGLVSLKMRDTKRGHAADERDEQWTSGVFDDIQVHI